jgi:hypothetical protein
MNSKDTSLHQQGRSVLRRLKWAVRQRHARLPWIGEAFIRRWHVRRYEKAMGAKLRLDPPVTFSEHLIHRILFDRDPRLKILSDKLAVRAMIEARVGAGYLVPLLGVWNTVADIEWEELPSSYALKPNHGSGMASIVLDSKVADRRALEAEARAWLASDYFDVAFEWGYKDLPRVIMAETLLIGPDGGPPIEVQVMTFHGKAVLMRVLTGKKGKGTRLGNWFDAHGVEQNLRSRGVPTGCYRLDPGLAHELAGLAARAAVGFAHLRVDFYVTAEGLKIGELTSYHAGGLLHWSDPRYNEMLGRCWQDPDEASRHSMAGLSI